jgi:hypothetical protein
MDVFSIVESARSEGPMIGNRVRAGVVGVLLLATAAGWPAPRPVGAATSAAVSIRLAYPSVDSGQAEHIDGQVSPPVPAGPVREVVTLQQFSANSWRDVKTAALDQSSAYDIAVKPPANTNETYTYRVVWNNLTSPSVTFTVRVLIYIGLSKLSVEVGFPEHVRGWMSPRLPGQVVTLQRQNRKTGASTDIRSGRTDAFGRYDIAVMSDIAGIYTYRIVWQNFASVHTVTVPVETWHYLSDLTPVFAPTTYKTGTVSIRGGHLPHAVWWESDAAFPSTSAQYRLKYHCDQVETLGVFLIDGSAAAKVQYDFFKDGSVSDSGFVVPGHTASAYSNLANTYRLTITATSLTPDSSVSDIAFVGAKINCAW